MSVNKPRKDGPSAKVNRLILPEIELGVTDHLVIRADTGKISSVDGYRLRLGLAGVLSIYLSVNKYFFLHSRLL